MLFRSRIDVFQWTGKPRGRYPLALPLSTWGRLNYELHGVEGSGSQGWIKQRVDWCSLGSRWLFNTYGAFNWRLRAENQTFYDANGPSLGLAFSRDGLDLGMEYLWQYFPRLRTTTRTLNIFLSWFYGWDLKKK